MTPEELAARRRDYADGGEDEHERTVKMAVEITQGAPRSESVACSTPEDERVWDILVAEIEAAKARGR